MSLKYLIFLLYCIPLSVNSQCKSNLVILLTNQKGKEAEIIKKNHPVEIITRYQTFSGRVSCVYPESIEVGEAPIPLQDIEVIISKRRKFKAQDAAALPMIYIGYGLGIAGSILVGTGLDFDDEDYNVAPFIAGLGALAGSAILLYSGYSLKTGNVPEENPIYGLEEWQATILPLRVARRTLQDYR